MISIFDIFKIGIGPSSSHTVGPMKAAAAFADLLNAENLDTQVARIVIEVYGSLALTGIGHGTFDALLLGLEGSLPHDIPLADIPQRLERIRTQHVLKLNGREMAFNPEKDLDIRGDKVLPKHPNGLNFIAYHSDGLKLKEQIYYSVGGGFIVTDEGFAQEAQENSDVPYPYKNCDELLAQCRLNQLNISEVVLANEAALAGCDEVEVRRRVAAVRRSWRPNSKSCARAKSSIPNFGRWCTPWRSMKKTPPAAASSPHRPTARQALFLPYCTISVNLIRTPTNRASKISC